MLSCQKATFLIEKSHSIPLSFLDKLQLSVHLKICDKCANYQRQSLIIENALKFNHQNLPPRANFKMADTSKALIHKAISDNFKNS